VAQARAIEQVGTNLVKRYAPRVPDEVAAIGHELLAVARQGTLGQRQLRAEDLTDIPDPALREILARQARGEHGIRSAVAELARRTSQPTLFALENVTLFVVDARGDLYGVNANLDREAGASYRWSAEDGAVFRLRRMPMDLYRRH
jgi:hypothetical protein